MCKFGGSKLKIRIRLWHSIVLIMMAGLWLFIAVDKNAVEASSWSTQIGTVEDDEITCVISDNQGYIFAVGTTAGSLFGNNAGLDDIFAVKYDSQGNQVWGFQTGTLGDDQAIGCALDTNGC